MSASFDENDPLDVAHKRHSIFHRDEVMSSETCGCFYCMEIFPPGEIVDWTDERNGALTTAICPHCCVDAVLGSDSGFPITPEFLRQMRDRWFGSSNYS